MAKLIHARACVRPIRPSTARVIPDLVAGVHPAPPDPVAASATAVLEKDSAVQVAVAKAIAAPARRLAEPGAKVLYPAPPDSATSAKADLGKGFAAKGVGWSQTPPHWQQPAT